MTRITPDMAQAPFLPDTVHKRDIFSETISGELEGVPDFPVVLRKLDGVPAYARPIAWALARKEIRALKAVQGIEGCPVLVRADRTGLLRSWTRGTPLQLAKPADAAWYRDAKRLLREMRRAGVTHNDIAKPQNWLRTPEGRAAVIDFQLASVHRRRGQLFRVMAREDLRHLLKQKRAYAPDLLTPSEHRMLAQKALPARIWMATGKRAYNFITRRLMNWSDGEGTEDRIERDGPTLRRALLAHDQIRDLALATYALPAHGVGLYAFVETDLDATALAALTPEPRPELIQPVAAPPRRWQPADGCAVADRRQPARRAGRADRRRSRPGRDHRAHRRPPAQPHRPGAAPLERRLGAELHALPAIGMPDAQFLRMQHEPRMLCRRPRGIERIAEDHMPQRQHMHPQLMRPPGLGRQPHPALAIARLEHPVFSERRPPRLVTDLLQRPVRPIHDERQIDHPGLGLEMALDPRRCTKSAVG